MREINRNIFTSAYSKWRGVRIWTNKVVILQNSDHQWIRIQVIEFCGNDLPHNDSTCCKVWGDSVPVQWSNSSWGLDSTVVRWRHWVTSVPGFTRTTKDLRTRITIHLYWKGILIWRHNFGSPQTSLSRPWVNFVIFNRSQKFEVFTKSKIFLWRDNPGNKDLFERTRFSGVWCTLICAGRDLIPVPTS